MSRLEDLDLIVFDGACGTSLQTLDIPESAWQGCEGCNELLNVTAPDIIQRMHSDFLDAGAMVVETNTFGAAATVLAEYGLEGRVDEINRAAVQNARAAVDGRENCFVAGSLGPTTKLASLGHISVDDLAAVYDEQMRVLLQAGVDCMIIETCQDMLQVKTAIVTAFEAMQAEKCEVPLLVSVTIEQTGTMLVGSDIAAVCATLEPFPIFSLGLNCATGPEAMESHMRYLNQQWPGRISCIPNQGLPEVVDGQTVYPMGPTEYAQHMRSFVDDYGVTVVGGCCGTTPAHIKAMVEELQTK